MASQPIEPIPVTQENLARAADGQRAVEHVITQLGAAAQDILAPAVDTVASHLAQLESHGKAIAVRINRVVGSRQARAKRNGTIIAAALTGPVQSVLDTVAQNSAALYDSVPEYSYHAGGPPANPSRAPMPTSVGVGATTTRALGQPGARYLTNGSGSSSSQDLNPVPLIAPPSSQPLPQPGELERWYCVINSADGCAVTTTNDPTKPLQPGYYYVGPYPDSYTASVSCAPGCVPVGPPIVPPPSPPIPPPIPGGSQWCAWCSAADGTSGVFDTSVTPIYVYTPWLIGCSATEAGAREMLRQYLANGGCATYPSTLIPPPSVLQPPTQPPQPPPGSTLLPPPSVLQPPTPAPTPPPTDDCQPCDVWAVNAQIQNLVNVTATSNATITANFNRLCHCINHAVRVLCECFGKPPPGAVPTNGNGAIEGDREWMPPPVLEPDFEEEGGYEQELQTEIAPFTVPPGGAVGGSTIGIHAPSQFGD